MSRPVDAPLRINNLDDLACAITLNEQFGAIGQAHLMRALQRGRISYLSLLPDTSATKFKSFARVTTDRPSVMLIGDDDGFDRGPDGWSLTPRAVAWARSIMVHGAGAEIVHYESAIVAAQLVGRCLVVECSSATLPAWIAVARAAAHRPPTLIIKPRDGVHPLPVDRSSMQ
jgi:hypothetical protein